MKGVFFSANIPSTNVIRDFDIPKPGDDEVLIKNVAVASNPKDWKVSYATTKLMIDDRVGDQSSRLTLDSYPSGRPLKATMSADTLKQWAKTFRASTKGTRSRRLAK
jgi:hypothetical protein